MVLSLQAPGAKWPCWLCDCVLRFPKCGKWNVLIDLGFAVLVVCSVWGTFSGYNWKFWVSQHRAVTAVEANLEMAVAAPVSLGKRWFILSHRPLSKLFPPPSPTFAAHLWNLALLPKPASQRNHPKVTCDPPEPSRSPAGPWNDCRSDISVSLTARWSNPVDSSNPNQTPLEVHAWMKCRDSCLMAQSDMPYPQVILSLVPLSFC